MKMRLFHSRLRRYVSQGIEFSPLGSQLRCSDRVSQTLLRPELIEFVSEGLLSSITFESCGE